MPKITATCGSSEDKRISSANGIIQHDLTESSEQLYFFHGLNNDIVGKALVSAAHYVWPKITERERKLALIFALKNGVTFAIFLEEKSL